MLNERLARRRMNGHWPEHLYHKYVGKTEWMHHLSDDASVWFWLFIQASESA